jgi:anthranilate phosphoribosyltransferase
MLSVAKEHLLNRAATAEERESIEKFVIVHGRRRTTEADVTRVIDTGGPPL